MSEWIGAHLFYYSNPNPLLSGCVYPLVQELRNDALIERYFFIRYWEGGPHVRLRLLPAEASAEAEIRRRVEVHAAAFFARRPALYEIDRQAMAPAYRDMFVAEYGEEKYQEKYGATGMPFYDSNTVQYIPYEPETQRFGGLAGLQLSERHFQESSDIIIDVVRRSNLHLRPIMLGTAMQMSLLLCYGMLKTDERVRGFLDRYYEFWAGFQSRGAPDRMAMRVKRFERRYQRIRDKVHARFHRIRAVMTGAEPATEYERRWLTHCDALAGDVARLRTDGMLELPPLFPAEIDAVTYLLTSYLHMSNNRVGASIDDEIYMTYVSRRGLDEIMGVPAPVEEASASQPAARAMA